MASCFVAKRACATTSTGVRLRVYFAPLPASVSYTHLHDEELVAAHAAQRRPAGKRRAQGVGEPDEAGVARLVAERVVDGLEAVHVEVGDGERTPVLQQVLDGPQAGAPRDQAGEGIARRDVYKRQSLSVALYQEKHVSLVNKTANMARRLHSPQIRHGKSLIFPEPQRPAEGRRRRTAVPPCLRCV